jgi:hypothetical protein
LLDQVSALKGLAGGDLGYFLAIFRAHLGFIDWLFSRKERARPLPRKCLEEMDGVYKRNVVWAHFARGKKYFREIVFERAG